ncbi:MAG: YtxH domain-containing protein [Acidobacteriota bacterium]|nr:MAG: YtxH domain-containing protein [Acidobacteriota bacterium]
MAQSGEKFLYFLIGGFVGASVALLFAPKTGEETRQLLESKYRTGTEELNRRVRSGREYITHAKEDLTERVSGTVDRGREVIAKQKDQISSAIEAGKKAYDEEKAKLESNPEEA